MQLICAGYEERVMEERRQTRVLMFTMVKLMGDAKDITPEELWPLPGDEVISNQLTDDDLKQIFAEIDKK